VNPETRILYCDPSCVAVNKLPGEVVEGAKPGMPSLPELVARELARGDYPTLSAKDALSVPVAAHRLDAPVSGCVLFARNRRSLAFLNNAFRENAVEKRYWAIAELPKSDSEFAKLFNLGNNICYINGSNNENDIDTITGGNGEMVELTHWLAFDPKMNKSRAYDERAGNRKKAVLRCRVAGCGSSYLFLEIALVTGRHHQIRAQLARLGVAIKGDLKYGARRSEKLGGIRLHARSLRFPNPEHAGAKINVLAEVPRKDNLWDAYCRYLPDRPDDLPAISMVP